MGGEAYPRGYGWRGLPQGVWVERLTPGGMGGEAYPRGYGWVERLTPGGMGGEAYPRGYGWVERLTPGGMGGWRGLPQGVWVGGEAYPRGYGWVERLTLGGMGGASAIAVLSILEYTGSSWSLKEVQSVVPRRRMAV